MPALWHDRDFRLVTAGQTVTQLGAEVSALAFPLTAVLLLDATPWQLGVLVAVQNGAFLVAGLPAGVLLDRRRRRPVLILTDVVRAVALTVVTVAAAAGGLSFGLLLAVSAVMSLMRVVFEIGYQTYLPSIVPTRHLVQGNSTVEAIRASGQIAGPSLGGALVQVAGAATALLADALSFLVSALLLWRVRTPEPAAAHAARRRPMVGQMREGIRFVLADPVLRAVAATSALSNLLFVAANALNVFFLVETVGVSAATAGLLFSIGSAAALVAAAVATRLARWLGSARIIWVSVTVTSPFNLLIPLTGPGWRLAFFAAGICVGGAGQLVYAITQLSYRQAVVPAAILGRVNATMRFLVMGLLPVGGLLGGALAGLSSVRTTLWVIAAGLTLAPVFLILSPLRRAREVSPSGPEWPRPR
ncbi:MFS transporter [Paractinoplanes atraurantiacus]|uniref:Predicted arabinose efflux permease, MFS family n=1 Tax=Paractinoplanes atraurantiacus TaxID=1036182 RepID=A0A285J512_9ACTN|nr:MFS transporter [Actinoplanes atraurantiacus]SNY55302.1 Predicted arabinose efflux permease, MFS family [Actinoplanes atraurantiacus]